MLLWVLLGGESHHPPLKCHFSAGMGAASDLGTRGTHKPVGRQQGRGQPASRRAATAIYPTKHCPELRTLTFSGQGCDDGQGQEGLQGGHFQQCAARVA